MKKIKETNVTFDNVEMIDFNWLDKQNVTKTTDCSFRDQAIRICQGCEISNTNGEYKQHTVENIKNSIDILESFWFQSRNMSTEDRDDLFITTRKKLVEILNKLNIKYNESTFLGLSDEDSKNLGLKN